MAYGKVRVSERPSPNSGYFSVFALKTKETTKIKEAG
jgi:hypothetical protein